MYILFINIFYFTIKICLYLLIIELFLYVTIFNVKYNLYII